MSFDESDDGVDGVLIQEHKTDVVHLFRFVFMFYKKLKRNQIHYTTIKKGCILLPFTEYDTSLCDHKPHTCISHLT